MFDIFVLGKNNLNYKKLKEKFIFLKKADDLDEARSKSLTSMYWVVWDDIVVDDSFNFDYSIPKWDTVYTHVFKNGKHVDGICLFPKKKEFSKKEIDYRFFIDKKEIDTVASHPKKYDIFAIDSYDEYLAAMENSTTEMFWMTSRNIKVADDFKFDLYFDHHNSYDRNENHTFIHRANNSNQCNGVFLLSKNKPVSKKEIDHRFLVDRKEWDIVVSGPVQYDIFAIDSYDEYLAAMENSTTEMFWMTSRNIKVADDFKFDLYFTHDNEFDRSENHAFLHKVNDKLTYDGIFLLSKNKPVSKKEIDHRFIIDRKEWDIVASTNRPYDIFAIDSFDEYLSAVKNTTTEMFWMTSRNIKVADDFKFDIFFDDRDDIQLYDRNENHAFLHKVNDKLTYDGIFLLSKNKPVSKKEIDHRFLVDRKEWDIVASTNRLYDIFEIDSFDEYTAAMENATTEMFWMTSRNIKVADDFKFDIFFDDRDDQQIYDRRENHAFVHRVNDKDYYNGVFLLSRKVPLSKREIENKFLINKKEWGIVASGPKEYDKFTIDTYEDYQTAVSLATTEMFWLIPKEVETEESFKFDLYFTHDDVFNRNMHHAFQHKFRDTLTFNGINLVSKYKSLSEKEILYRFLVEKKDYETVASRLKPYDVVFISYNEPNADENYQNLLKRNPNAKRINGVKGIHNAHIKAAEISDTNMFWVIDGDAVIEDTFEFNYQVPIWDQTTVHVWNSKNPINDLVYGYGGVKLLPKNLTMNMKVDTTDMTTSISKSFKVINEISNTSAFNLDEFSTWRSAFRECVKLASKSIERQLNEETQHRLSIWSSVGKDKQYGEYAIKGANAAIKFVNENPDKLHYINNFDLLKDLFLKDNV